MSIQHVSPDDTRAWFQAGDDDVLVGDVLDVIASPDVRVRFGRYGAGAEHEWIVTHDETMVVTRGALRVRHAGGSQTVRAGEVASLSRGTRVVYRGEEDGTEVVFVTYVPTADAPRLPRAVSDVPRRATHGAPALAAAPAA